MDYRALAQAFLDLQALLYQAPAARQLFSIDRGAWFAMQYLLRHGDVHPKELSREMGVTSARVEALLKGLERQGFAARTADPSDSRKVLVRLTPAAGKRFKPNGVRPSNSSRTYWPAWGRRTRRPA